MKREGIVRFVWASRDVIAGSVFVGTVLAAMARANPMFAGAMLFFVLAFSAIVGLTIREKP